MVDDTVDPLANIRNAKYRHFRAMDPAHPFPSPLEPGEIAVNTANMQIAVGDADITTEGVPLELIAVRFWNSRSQYDTGEFVVMGGDIYQSLEPIAARTGFDPAQWRNVTGGTGAPAAPTDGKLYGMSHNGIVYVWVETVNRAGDSMLGDLLLQDVPTPVDPLSAVPKKWVEGIPIAFPVVGKPLPATSLFIPVTIPMTIPTGLVGTLGFANVASTGAPVFTLNHIAVGGVVTPIGTITATAGSRTAFVLIDAGATLDVGDVIQMTSPSPQDATLADVGITLLALRA